MIRFVTINNLYHENWEDKVRDQFWKINEAVVSGSRFYVRIEEKYYEYKEDINLETLSRTAFKRVNIEDEFTPRDIRKIIECGRFDIFVYDNHA